MKHVLDYLVAHPEKGLLAYEMGIPTIVHYWRSFERLEAFAKDKEDPHLDVKAGQYEAVYGNHGSARLGQSGAAVPPSRRRAECVWASGRGCCERSDRCLGV
jgi:hypothetical protein